MKVSTLVMLAAAGALGYVAGKRLRPRSDSVLVATEPEDSEGFLGSLSDALIDEYETFWGAEEENVSPAAPSAGGCGCKG